MYYYLYEITNLINHHKYLGVHQTEDMNDGYMGSGNLIRAAIKKYGLHNFSKRILEMFDTPERMYEREREVITPDIVDDPTYYNLREGGWGGGYLAEETRQQMSISQSRFYDTHPERREYLSNLQRERMKNPAIYQRHVNKMKKVNGRRLAEWTQKHKTGVPLSAEHRMKMSKTRRGRPHSEQHRKALTAALRKHSYEIFDRKTGETHITNSLQQWCKDNHITPITTLYRIVDKDQPYRRFKVTKIY